MPGDGSGYVEQCRSVSSKSNTKVCVFEGWMGGSKVLCEGWGILGGKRKIKSMAWRSSGASSMGDRKNSSEESVLNDGSD